MSSRGGFDIRWAAAYLGLDVEDLWYWLDNSKRLTFTEPFSIEDLELIRKDLDGYRDTWEPLMFEDEKQNPVLFMQRLKHFIRFPGNFKFRRPESFCQ